MPGRAFAATALFVAWVHLTVGNTGRAVRPLCVRCIVLDRVVITNCAAPSVVRLPPLDPELTPADLSDQERSEWLRTERTLDNRIAEPAMRLERYEPQSFNLPENIVPRRTHPSFDRSLVSEASPAPTLKCEATCFGYTCDDDWSVPVGCDELDFVYSCDCSGCDCTTTLTSESTMTEPALSTSWLEPTHADRLLASNQSREDEAVPTFTIVVGLFLGCLFGSLSAAVVVRQCLNVHFGRDRSEDEVNARAQVSSLRLPLIDMDNLDRPPTTIITAVKIDDAVFEQWSATDDVPTTCRPNESSSFAGLDKLLLPTGWRKVASRSRAGHISHQNMLTGERFAQPPTKPATSERFAQHEGYEAVHAARPQSGQGGEVPLPWTAVDVDIDDNEIEQGSIASIATDHSTTTCCDSQDEEWNRASLPCAIGSSPAPIFTIDHEMRIVSWSPGDRWLRCCLRVPHHISFISLHLSVRTFKQGCRPRSR